jgi:hypothetical protein
MKSPLRFVLILTAITAAAFLVLAVACGGGGEKATTASPTATAAKTPKASPTTTAAKTPAAAETPAAGETPAAAETPATTPAGAAGELPNIPAYPGATEVFTGTFNSGGAFPIPLSGDVPISPGDFGNVQYSVYQTSDSSDKVVDFYKTQFQGWKEEGTFDLSQSGQKGKVVMWTKDNRNVAAWMGAIEQGGGTSVVVAMGARQQ